MDPTRKNKTDKSASKPRSTNSSNDHDAPNSIEATDDISDEVLIGEVERNNSHPGESDDKNNQQDKITNNDNTLLENTERPGESEGGIL